MKAIHVLVIDDEENIRANLKAYLEDSGYQVTTAGQGREGLDLVQKSLPDVVLCDLRMPGMDGLDVLRSLKAHYPNLPVIVVSGMGVMEDVVVALREGASDYIFKPLNDMEVLEHAINSVLEKRRLEQALEQANRALKQDMEAARQLQIRLLPASPVTLANCDIRYRIQPSHYLSGDFVDYFSVNEHQIGFYMADVSGHGASSAMVTFLMKSLANRVRRQYSSGELPGPLTPSTILSITHRELKELAIGKHLAAFVGMVDLRENTLTYSTAAHFPEALLVRDGQIEPLPGKGDPVGLFDEASYKDTILPLGDDWSLVVCSDGVLEVMPQDSIAEKEQALLAMVAEGAHTLEMLCENLGLDAVDNPPDDITILVVRKNRNG